MGWQGGGSHGRGGRRRRRFRLQKHQIQWMGIPHECRAAYFVKVPRGDVGVDDINDIVGNGFVCRSVGNPRFAKQCTDVAHLFGGHDWPDIMTRHDHDGGGVGHVDPGLASTPGRHGGQMGNPSTCAGVADHEEEIAIGAEEGTSFCHRCGEGGVSGVVSKI